MIYVSTGGINKQPAWKTSEQLFNNGIKNIELSAGLYDSGQLKKLKSQKKKINFQLHNYFPPPSRPFVLNLASQDEEIIKKSMDHLEKALYYSAELECGNYSFHAGFLFDPCMSSLGKKIRKKKLFDRIEAKKNFIDRVNKIADKALKLGINLQIENNVISLKNYQEFQSNPFLMVTSDECKEVMLQTPSNVNLLVDVAHLKVSSNTLKFSTKSFFNECYKWIGSYHLSDNNGKIDTNSEISDQSWFWSFIKKETVKTLEIYNTPFKILYEQYILAQNINNKL